MSGMRLARSNPLLDQSLFDVLNEGAKVDAHGVVCNRDSLASLACKSGDERLMGCPIGGHPRVLERIASDEFLDLIANEALNSAGQRLRQRMQWGRNTRRQPALGESVHRLVGKSLYVEAHEDLGGDLVSDCILYRRIAGERSDGCDVTVGVGD